VVLQLVYPPPPLTPIIFFDGLRGWAALVVAFSHISAAINGLMSSPAGRLKIPIILDAAGFAVQIFFVLSGLVLSLGFMQNKDLSGLGDLAVKRIPRFAIPCLFSAIIVYLMLKNNLMYNHTAAVTENGNAWLNEHYTFEPTA
jgi:peptidoglycan/LPS O-acetylase OafA/YrhL